MPIYLPRSDMESIFRKAVMLTVSFLMASVGFSLVSDNLLTTKAVADRIVTEPDRILAGHLLPGYTGATPTS